MARTAPGTSGVVRKIRPATVDGCDGDRPLGNLAISARLANRIWHLRQIAPEFGIVAVKYARTARLQSPQQL